MSLVSQFSQQLNINVPMESASDDSFLTMVRPNRVIQSAVDEEPQDQEQQISNNQVSNESESELQKPISLGDIPFTEPEQKQIKILLAEDSEIHYVLIDYIIRNDCKLIAPVEIYAAQDGREAFAIL